MKEAVDAGRDGGPGERLGRVQAAGLKLVPPSPITDLRRAVKDEIDAGDRRRARRGIGQIAAHDLRRPARRGNRSGSPGEPRPGRDRPAARQVVRPDDFPEDRSPR